MGTEFIVGSLIASHFATAGLGWFVGHKGAKAAMKAITDIPADITLLKNEVDAIKTKIGM